MKTYFSIETNAAIDEYHDDGSTIGIHLSSGFCLIGIERFEDKQVKFAGLIILNIAFRIVTEKTP